MDREGIAYLASYCIFNLAKLVVYFVLILVFSHGHLPDFPRRHYKDIVFLFIPLSSEVSNLVFLIKSTIEVTRQCRKPERLKKKKLRKASIALPLREHSETHSATQNQLL